MYRRDMLTEKLQNCNGFFTRPPLSPLNSKIPTKTKNCRSIYNFSNNKISRGENGMIFSHIGRRFMKISTLLEERKKIA